MYNGVYIKKSHLASFARPMLPIVALRDKFLDEWLDRVYIITREAASERASSFRKSLQTASFSRDEFERVHIVPLVSETEAVASMAKWPFALTRVERLGLLRERLTWLKVLDDMVEKNVCRALIVTDDVDARFNLVHLPLCLNVLS